MRADDENMARGHLAAISTVVPTYLPSTGREPLAELVAYDQELALCSKVAEFTAFYDAKVLYPAELRNLFMHLALTGLFRAKFVPCKNGLRAASR